MERSNKTFKICRMITKDLNKAIIIKNNDGTYHITHLDGKDFEIHYKIGEKEYTMKIRKNLDLMSLNDLKFYGIEFVNLEDIYKK